MAYVPVPKDLTKVKTKVALNLTKRQLICFGAGVLIGAPLFFLLLRPLGSSTAAMCMMLVMLPFFLLGVYEKNADLVSIGAYKSGTNPKLDHALTKMDAINQFLMQGVDEAFSYEESLDQLRRILK